MSVWRFTSKIEVVAALTPITLGEVRRIFPLPTTGLEEKATSVPAETHSMSLGTVLANQEASIRGLVCVRRLSLSNSSVPLLGSHLHSLLDSVQASSSELEAEGVRVILGPGLTLMVGERYPYWPSLYRAPEGWRPGFRLAYRGFHPGVRIAAAVY